MTRSFICGDRALGVSGDLHPLWSFGYGSNGRYRAVGASAVGHLHRQRREPRDDSYQIRSSGDLIAVAVADGVGSRPFSRYGASYVVELLTVQLLRQVVAPMQTSDHAAPSASSRTDAPALSSPDMLRLAKELDQLHLQRLLLSDDAAAGVAEAPRAGMLQSATVSWSAPSSDAGRQTAAAPTRSGTELEDVMRQAVAVTHQGLIERARSLRLTTADLGCTALALLFDCSSGQWVAGQIGDGAIIGLNADGGAWELVNERSGGHPQLTATIGQPDYEQYFAVQTGVSDATTFLLMTDGVSGDVLYSPQPDALSRWAGSVRSHVRQHGGAAQAAGGLLEWLATYQAQASWDDRTLVVVTEWNEHADHD